MQNEIVDSASTESGVGAKTTDGGAPQFGYRVVFDQRCVSEVRPDKPYGDWSSTHENSLRGVYVNAEHPDVVSETNIAPGQEGFLVWAEWSSGDSFGRGERSNVEAFGLFADYDKAYEYKKDLDAPKDGRWLPWSGYFESLDELHIEKVMVQRAD